MNIDVFESWLIFPSVFYCCLFPCLVSEGLAAAVASLNVTDDSNPSSGTTAAAAKARRRLSVMGAKNTAEISKLDGISQHEAKQTENINLQDTTPSTSSNTGRCFKHYASLSKVGYVPFNPHKVNQDRAMEVTRFGDDDEKALFGVFDGHGALGHEVSEFLRTELPKFFLKQPNLSSQPIEAITKAFLDCNTKLASGSIDCTFSGSTGIACYLQDGKLYSCNAGDSRAVLARQSTVGEETKFTAIPLSSDQKPERSDEKERIIKSKGRVEACKGMKGEDIGPLRVWL